MSTRDILPVKISLTGGDFYTLWAPTWRENGAEWQAFLGDEHSVLVFSTPEQLLAYLEVTPTHDLSDHPAWREFQQRPADRVVPADEHYYDIIGAPDFLAGHPSYVNVSSLDKVFRIARSLADVSSAEQAQIFFASHSILGNISRGTEHFAGDNGGSEWSGVGRVVLANWEGVVRALDGAVRLADGEVPDEASISDAAARIAAAREAHEEERRRAEEERKAAQEAADPYDDSIWARAGIDPVRVSIQGKSVYTLRTYMGGAPVFLGKYGEIFTFPSGKHLTRWITDNDEHDLAGASTWSDLTSAANAGGLQVEVHPDNSYSFNGIAEDVRTGPDAVDTAQMSKAYELLADAADWAKDDSLNSFLLANPRMQDYLAYMLGSTEAAGYVPSAPFDDKAEAWQELENQLVKRFSKF